MLRFAQHDNHCRRSRFLFFLTVCLCAGSACERSVPQALGGSSTATAAPGVETLVTITFGGLERSYLVYVPASVHADSPAPLVFVFHGYTGSAEDMRYSSGFDRFADTGGFIAVYPNGTEALPRTLSWNGGGCCGSAQRDNVDDVGYIRRIIGDLQAAYNIDSRRIFTTGMSNGGIFSYRLACEMADTFAAAAPVAGAAMYGQCSPAAPISILHIHGLDDNVIPYFGSTGADRLNGLFFPPVEAEISNWAAWNGCPGKATVEETGSNRHTVYAPCRAGTAVELHAIAGLGHRWPEAEFPASQTIWEFFQVHPKQ